MPRYSPIEEDMMLRAVEHYLTVESDPVRAKALREILRKNAQHRAAKRELQPGQLQALRRGSRRA